MKNRASIPGPAAAQSAPTTNDTAAHPLEWPASAGAVDDVLREMNARLIRRRHRRTRLVAGAAAALVVIGLGCFFVARDRATMSASHGTAPVASLPKQETLPDGSVVEFRNGAGIVVEFSTDFRRVKLERGEAHFNVAKNPARPFIVSAGGVDFRAVGTAFTVNLAATKVEMLVTEGKVAVVANAQPSDIAPSSSDLIAEAGNHVLVSIDGAKRSMPVVTPVSPAQLSQRLAWRAPKLEFTATPLADAIELINTHAAAGNRPVLRLGDASLATVRISGILRADNIETLIGVLEADYGLKADRNGDKEIVLRRAEAAP